MRVIDLFAGCGGLSLGFQQAGFDIVAAFENWQPAIDVYQANFKHTIHNIDLSNVSDCSIFTQYEPDIMIGGPPCQDFSSAGKRNENNGRGDLTISFAKIIGKVRPRWFVMENVDRIIATEKLKIAKRLFYEVGYGLTEAVLNASFCGVPQIRKRFFLVGLLDAEDHFLEYELNKRQSKIPMTVYDYLGNRIDTEFYYRHPRSYARRGIFSIHEPSPTIRGVNRPIPKGYKKHKGDLVDDLSNVRPLTTKERSLIQTFPENFEWIGCKTEQEQLIGNAVPVNLAKFVGDCIENYLKTERHTHSVNTKVMLFC
ncbi:MAG: DNA cytosine methyltransferase [Planctomycetaceae bacterium]|jgi:DNA (cytosine-5)-methyltransferase 1|nr:DNA cytosine methyltransferase [Planctomycetaceae bacterium]